MHLFEKYKTCLSCNEKLNSLDDFNYCTNLFCEDKFIVYENYIEYEKYFKDNTNYLICCNYETKEFKFLVFKYGGFRNYHGNTDPILEVNYEIDDDFDFIASFSKIEKSIKENGIFT